MDWDEGSIGRVKMKRIMLLLIGILLLASCASAWTIQSKDYTGSINFFADGTAVATVDGYPQTEFAWAPMAVQPTNGNYLYEASYFGYRVQFEYNPLAKTITSPQFPGARLV